ncbi:MAG: septum formation inhibitor Maf [Burkholderiales bacterium]|nr:MAG: septum formation inhibitor Maf [Burkholderiales bacterium]
MIEIPAPPFVWLASQSPRRQALLEQIGLRFALLLAGPEEDAEALEAVRVGESPTQYVERVVLAKADAARARLAARALPAAPILVADTTVAIGGTILGKPVDDDDARRMLRLLSGRGHRVLTALAVVRGARVTHRVQVSQVRFARLSDSDVDAYVASGEPRGKAGGYAIQGRAAAFVRRIEGSHSGIMGLPLHETATLLRPELLAMRHLETPSEPPSATPASPAPDDAR